MYEKKPWLEFYDDHVPEFIDYPRTTMYKAVVKTAEKYPNSIAYDFLGQISTYKEMIKQIDQCARALANLGLKNGDRMTISMPTSPQGVICFYAVNKIGAIASMIHPLSPPKQIEFFLNLSESIFALTIDKVYPNFKQILGNTNLKTLILTQFSQDVIDLADTKQVFWWKDIIAKSYPEIPEFEMDPDEMAVILYSGGTTGVPKGIMLS
ncbi:hypothetical protein LCGC14_2628240, partial [marine sediment metagenome]